MNRKGWEEVREIIKENKEKLNGKEMKEREGEEKKNKKKGSSGMVGIRGDELRQGA